MTEKKINSDLEKLPACAAGFIKLVIKKMGYRKKVRADVMAELITHFEDELKGIATAEQKAQQLIEQFGDVKLLAKLIRRGKKRCRPIWQKVLIRSFVTVSVFILYVLVRVAFLKIGTATISVDYAQWLTERSRADRPEQGNAYPHYKKAVGMYVTSPKSIRGKLRRMTLVCPMPSGYNLKDFNDMDVDQLAKWLAENEPAFEILRAGSVKPYYWAPYSGGDKSLMEGPLIIGANEQLGPYRKLAQAMLTNIYLQVSMDNTPQALNDSLVLNSFGMHLQGRGLLIEQMVGIAIEGVGHRAILQMLKRYPTNSGQFKLFQKRLGKLFEENDLVINFECETAFWYDFIQRGFTDDGMGSGRVLDMGAAFVAKDVPSALLSFFFFEYPDRRETVAMVDSYFQQSQEFLEQTPWQQQNVKGQWEEIQEGASFILRMLGPAHTKVGQLGWRVKTERTAVLVVLALQQWQLDKGLYPANLDELVAAGYLKEMPMDPFSGKPLVYKKTDDGFTLYSVGLNFTDDGGIVGRDKRDRVSSWADEGDTIFWPTE